MTISERITQARHDRSARSAVRAEREKLVRELSAYRTPAERTELQLIAARSPQPEAALVLNILDQLTFIGGRDEMRRSA